MLLFHFLILEANDGEKKEAPLRVQRGNVEARASTRRCKSPWKTRASSRLIRTVCKLKRVSVRFFFFSFFSFSFFSSFFLFFLSGVRQLVFASGLNADLNTKRETAILLRPWGLWTTRRPCETYIHLLGDPIETKQNRLPF